MFYFHNPWKPFGRHYTLGIWPLDLYKGSGSWLGRFITLFQIITSYYWDDLFKVSYLKDFSNLLKFFHGALFPIY